MPSRSDPLTYQELAVALGLWSGMFRETTAEAGIEAKAERSS
jgi:hypothetical protein